MSDRITNEVSVDNLLTGNLPLFVCVYGVPDHPTHARSCPVVRNVLHPFPRQSGVSMVPDSLLTLPPPSPVSLPSDGPS